MSGGPQRTSKMQQRQEDRQEAEQSINAEAQLIALRRKAAAWGANEDEESITGFTGRWEALSNWFPATVVWSGKQYPSVEHAFQAAKAAAEPEHAEAIRKAASPKEAHSLGQQVALPPTWERQRLKLMETLLRDKFRRDGALRERLLRTETKNLIANNKWGEAFWGVSGGNGANNLGAPPIGPQPLAPWAAASRTRTAPARPPLPLLLRAARLPSPRPAAGRS